MSTGPDAEMMARGEISERLYSGHHRVQPGTIGSDKAGKDTAVHFRVLSQHEPYTRDNNIGGPERICQHARGQGGVFAPVFR
eukprot:COSAG06_NODE_21_length_33796_cov_70.184853_25_plen_82_part_00